jgi:hypothetical protein
LGSHCPIPLGFSSFPLSKDITVSLVSRADFFYKKTC